VRRDTAKDADEKAMQMKKLCSCRKNATRVGDSIGCYLWDCDSAQLP